MGMVKNDVMWEMPVKAGLKFGEGFWMVGFFLVGL